MAIAERRQAIMAFVRPMPRPIESPDETLAQ
jgi:hypothetical protein